MYVCTGFCCPDPTPSPKCQLWLVQSSVLVDKGREVEVWECGSDVTVRARVEGRPETTFQFMMVREDGAWCTDGVRVEC